MGYSPWDRKELDTTEHAHTHLELEEPLNKIMKLFGYC